MNSELAYFFRYSNIERPINHRIPTNLGLRSPLTNAIIMAGI